MSERRHEYVRTEPQIECVHLGIPMFTLKDPLQPRLLIDSHMSL